MTVSKAFSAIIASTALVFTGITPAMAAPVDPAIAPALPIAVGELGWSSEKDVAHRDRRWRGHRGYGRGHHRRHRGRVNGGDVLAGILILGGIAAIASAASKNKRDRRYDDRDYRNERRSDNRRSDERSDTRNSRGTGAMDQAINACANAAERKAGSDARVSEIKSVSKDGAGWRVEGDLSNSKERTFLCGSTDGRVDFVQLGSGDLAYNN